MDPIKKEWIKEKDLIDDAVVQWAEKTGKILAEKGLTTSTIRRFFGEMRRIQANFEDNKNDVPLLRAKLAYDVGRKKGKGVPEFYAVLSPGISAIELKKERFNRFVKIAEAIVAFHKFYSGDNS